MDREKFTVSVEIIAVERFEVSSLLIPWRYFARSVSRKRLMWYDVELRVVNKEEVSNFCNQCDGRKRYSLRRDKCNLRVRNGPLARAGSLFMSQG